MPQGDALAADIEDADGETLTRVGVLLVHGVGEQHQFEHLEAEARHIARALEGLAGVEKTGVAVRTSLDGAAHADQITWQADNTAPVFVDVRTKGGGTTRIEFREVWWADLDERSTLWSQVKFWLWGLAQWAEVGNENEARGLSDFLTLRPPQPPSGPHSRLAWLSIRLRLFALAAVFFLVLPTLLLINFVFRRFLKGRLPGPDIIASYVGDVKLLVQPGTQGSGALSDLNLPPRVTIRRRMVRGLADMATEDYNRWYILAHSLGTVVAHNALMETELCLPNYLDERRWNSIQSHGMGGRSQRQPPDSAAGKTMRPARPTWLDDQDIIYRLRLFAGLRGFLTYGSPLDKFSALWPWIVPINDEPVFPRDFQWINVYDETDPIAGKLDDFDPLGTPAGPAGAVVAKPANFAFLAYPVLLLSHLRYLKFRPDHAGRLVQRVAAWLMESGGSGFPIPDPDTDRDWQFGGCAQGLRRAWRYLQWTVVALFLAWLLGYLLSLVPRDSLWPLVTLVLPPTEAVLQFTECCPRLNLWLSWIVYDLVLAAVVAFVAGLFRMAGAHRLVQ